MKTKDAPGWKQGGPAIVVQRTSLPRVESFGLFQTGEPLTPRTGQASLPVPKTGYLLLARRVIKEKVQRPEVTGVRQGQIVE